MSDLADHELQELLNGEPDTDQCERAAKEIQRLRSAIARVKVIRDVAASSNNLSTSEYIAHRLIKALNGES